MAVALACAAFPGPSEVPATVELIERLPAQQLTLLSGFIPDDGLRVQFPNGQVLAFRQGTTEPQSQAVAKAYGSILEDELNARRKRFILLSFLAWFVPLVAIYALGEAIAWVRTGFKSTSSR